MTTPITLEEAQAQLTVWLTASRMVATGKEYVIGTRRLYLEDAAEIRNQINYWEAKVVSLQASVSGNRSLGNSVAVFVDD